jgi:hypothetical protein
MFCAEKLVSVFSEDSVISVQSAEGQWTRLVDVGPDQKGID